MVLPSISCSAGIRSSTANSLDHTLVLPCPASSSPSQNCTAPVAKSLDHTLCPEFFLIRPYLRARKTPSPCRYALSLPALPPGQPLSLFHTATADRSIFSFSSSTVAYRSVPSPRSVATAEVDQYHAHFKPHRPHRAPLSAHQPFMFPTSARYEPQINRSSLVPLQSCSFALRSPRSTLRQPVATSLCSILTGNHWPTPYRLSSPSTQALCFSLWLSPTLLISSPIPLHTQTSQMSLLPFKPVRLLCVPLAAFSGQASCYLLRSPPTILLPTLSHCTHRPAK